MPTGVQAEVLVREADLPALFLAADRAARSAARRHFGLVRAQLLSTLLGPLLSAGLFLPFLDRAAVTLGILATASLLASLILTLMLELLRVDRAWHALRFLAESVRAEAWQYAARAGPYATSASEGAADLQLQERLRAELRRTHDDTGGLGGDEALRPQITSPMREMRALDVSSRRDAYLAGRLRTQVAWYARQGARARSARHAWLGATLAFQCLAIAGAGMLLIGRETGSAWVGLFATAAGTALAWGNARRYKEIAPRYSRWSQELSLLGVRAVEIDSDGALAAFVAEAETAIRREHEIWLLKGTGDGS